MYSLVKYNVINNNIGECICVTENDCALEAYKKIRDMTVAGWNNGDMIFLIDGDWRKIPNCLIKQKCLSDLLVCIARLKGSANP